MRLFNKNWRTIGAVLLCTFAFNACDLNDITDPNSPSLEGVESDATLGEIQNLVTGIEAGMRAGLNQYYDGVCMIGREYWRFSSSDPRFTSDLLGKGSAILDNNTFYTTLPYADRYSAVKNCNILLTAIDNTTAAVTNEQKSAARGYAKTIKAHQLLMILNEQYADGIRVDVSDPNRLGPFLPYSQALDAIHTLIEEGIGELAAGGPSFPFKVGSGFAGFETPNDFNLLANAIAARISAYRSSWDDVLEHLDNSFADPFADLDQGAYYTYSAKGGDQLNPMWLPLNNSGELRVAHPSFIADAEAGDTRLSKVTKRTDTATSDGLSGDYDFTVYATNTTPIPIIRNEELILLHAEASIQKNDFVTGKDELDLIRLFHNLPVYGGTIDQPSLINEMLKQRRYSLYGEGHRWVDMRRYNKLDELPIDRPGDDVWESFPRPANEH